MGRHSNADLGRPEKTVMKHVSRLKLVHDLVLCPFLGHMGDHFMEGRLLQIGAKLEGK